MLINKELAKLKLIFVRDVNIEYLNLLCDLGSFPIVMKITPKGKIPFIYRKSQNKVLDIFSFERCSVTDIKHILRICDTVVVSYFSHKTLQSPMLFLHMLNNVFNVTYINNK